MAYLLEFARHAKFVTEPRRHGYVTTERATMLWRRRCRRVDRNVILLPLSTDVTDVPMGMPEPTICLMTAMKRVSVKPVMMFEPSDVVPLWVTLYGPPVPEMRLHQTAAAVGT
jgi:hypothetical protein